jgi:hypothetical protein
MSFYLAKVNEHTRLIHYKWHILYLHYWQALSRSGSEETSSAGSDACMHLGPAENSPGTRQQGNTLMTRNNSLQLEPRRKMVLKGQMSNGIIRAHASSSSQQNVSVMKLGRPR